MVWPQPIRDGKTCSLMTVASVMSAAGPKHYFIRFEIFVQTNFAIPTKLGGVAARQVVREDLQS
jgi:hypothetical protein